ncbi:tumor necrosis factor receptor superfamily member 17 isoform X2 [Onychostoma macrolepis]|uniref:tumor necrosis factor receptor superfamily member 17 isoform X2 n=1 Tax=Onychostoma macrolepis TaxID=369639 RepID=UPI00272C2BB8|nr:tumor necrosis factor receptor superfamily member 17 isoform X2 [Onychostoma macrolepis]
MLLFILLLYIIIYAEGKCAKNYYYDGLLEECQHCSIRCNSPPIICKTFCTSTFTVLTIILRVIRRKTCKPIMNKVKGQEQKTDSERGSNVTEQSEDTDGLNQHHYNSNLPLPSTEEGTTLLVTTKTVQAYHCTPVM